MNTNRSRREPVPSRRRFAALLFALACSLVATGASSHVVMGTQSLHLRVVQADLVVRARVLDPAFVFVSEDGKSRRELVEIEILETIKGRAEDQKLRFAQDGHEVAKYEIGQEALFFLESIAKSRELRSLAVPGGPSHVSGQEHDEQFLLGSASSEILLSATRDLVASESAPTAAARIALIRKATLDLLTSGDPQLGASALASLVMSPDAELVIPTDLPRLDAMLSDPKVSIGIRAGLIAELERRGLIDGDGYWRALLEKAAPEQRPTAIRVVGVHPSPAVDAQLFRWLADPDSSTELAAEAAMALGRPGNVAAVGPLAKALEQGEQRLRNAAIRGLGRIGGPEARRALQHAATHHPDPVTRKLAGAKLRAAEAGPGSTRPGTS